jgi:hypothetical protein
MFLFGRRKMRFRKRHVPTEPIKVVHLPNTGIGVFISQSVSRRRTVTDNFLSVSYDADVASNCRARGFRISASVDGIAWLRCLDVSKKLYLHMQCLWRRRILPTSKMNTSNFQKNWRFSISSEKYKISLSV